MTIFLHSHSELLKRIPFETCFKKQNNDTPCSSIVADAQTTINHNVMVMEMTTRCQIVRHLVGKNAL